MKVILPLMLFALNSLPSFPAESFLGGKGENPLGQVEGEIFFSIPPHPLQFLKSPLQNLKLGLHNR